VHDAVLVAVTQDAALALFVVGGPPGCVEVVQRDEAGLDVGADTHLLGGADEHVDVTGAAGIEQPFLGLVGVGLVDVADPGRVEACGGKAVAQFVVHVEPARRGALVTEHHLQAAQRR
jgi:hypothetical protein